MLACCGKGQGVGSITQELVRSAASLGQDTERIQEFLLWLLSLEDGMSGNEVARKVQLFASESGWEIAEHRLRGFKRLYELRRTAEFQIHFAQFLMM